MAFNNNITPGAPPLLWSNVYEAFTKINENFDILVATVGTGSGLSPINFETLDTSVSPATDYQYNLGSNTHRWKSLYVGEYTDALQLNGVWLGTAQIKGVGTTVNLPENSTVGGDPLTGIGANLIIDPNKTFFKTIEVDNNLSVVATTFGDTVNFLSGSGISLSVNSASDSIEIDNTGILTVAAGSGIAVSTVSGTATVTNDGVRSLQSTTALPSGRTTGAGINISGSTGDDIRITNTGVISVSNGVGITVSTDAATGVVTITNAAPAGNTFSQVEVNGDSANRLVADGTSDVLNITSGLGITLSKVVASDTLTITVNPVFDLKGSVFGDDSSILVDAVGNYIYGNVSATTLRTAETKIVLGLDAGGAGINAIAIGEMAGQYTQGNRALAVGFQAGLVNQGVRGIAIGQAAANGNQGANGIAIGETAAAGNQGINAIAIGQNAAITYQGDSAIAIGAFSAGDNQGANAIAIGRYATGNNQTASSIVLNATGSAITASAAGLYMDPIRSTTSSARPVVYNTTTKELFYTSTLEFINSTISTTDSSGLTIDVQTTFNTDVTVENDLNVTQRLRVQGSRVINLTELKSITAASTSFSDFQARIAALV